MPELPEVQAVVNFLNPIFKNSQIKSISSPNNYHNVFENGSLNDYKNFLKNKKIKLIWRRGKYIIFNFNNGFLLIHLRMTGQLKLALDVPKDLKYISFKINFLDNKKLYFKDVRKFGRVYIKKNINDLNQYLGVEPLSDSFTKDWLYKNLLVRNRMIKPLLLDQTIIAGLGNIYVDESLWEAGIHPKMISSKITRIKSNRLFYAIKNILMDSIMFNGTTIINFSYGNNIVGGFQKKLKVFRKNNNPCPKCKTSILKIFVSQRGTHFCKRCQPIKL